MKHTTSAVVLALLVALAGIPAVTGMQQAGYNVEVSVPDDATTAGNQTVSVTVENTGSDDLFNPIVELPIPSSATVPNGATANAYVTLADGSEESRTASVDTSTIQPGDAVFINGEEVPAGESRTYHVNLSFDQPGETTLETEVRPLYNESIAVQDSTTATITGIGALNADVVDSSGSTVTGATVTIDGVEYEANSSVTLPAGSYTVTATADGATLPTVTETVAAGENSSVTFVARSDLSTPGVLVRNGSADVIEPSVGSVHDRGSATTRASVDVSFLVGMNGGGAIVGLSDPAELSTVRAVSVTTDAATESHERNAGVLELSIANDGDTDVTVTYEGNKLGDATGDDTVDSADASAVAAAVASGSTTVDVNGDGEVNAVDAMLIAQYDAGNRDADYDLGGDA